jgi:hypothetical protein
LAQFAGTVKVCVPVAENVAEVAAVTWFADDAIEAA